MDHTEWENLKAWLVSMKVLDASVTSAEEIKRLDLSGHSLSELPEYFGMLSEVISLNLSNNHLHTLPDSVRSMAKLSNLDLRRNRFSKLPKVLSSLPLRSLNMSGNMLDDVSELSDNDEIRVLDLSMNSITTMDGVFNSENELRTVNLSHNYLKNVTNLFSLLPHTERLDISGNMISHIPETIGVMENLVDLKITDNVIEYMDDKLFDLPIEKLDLSSNKLYWIRLESLKELESVVLDFNPIKHIEVSDDFQAGPQIGYTNYFGKDFTSGSITIKSDDFGVIPILAKGQYDLTDQLNVEGGAGYAVFTEEGGGGEFTWRIGAGYEFADSWTAGIGFNSITGDASNLDSFFVGVRRTF